MMTDFKPYNKLTSLEKTARHFSGRAQCTDCPIYKRNNGRCANEDMITVCDYVFIKGFVSGTKHHRKLIRERNKKK